MGQSNTRKLPCSHWTTTSVKVIRPSSQTPAVTVTGANHQESGIWHMTTRSILAINSTCRNRKSEFLCFTHLPAAITVTKRIWMLFANYNLPFFLVLEQLNRYNRFINILNNSDQVIYQWIFHFVSCQFFYNYTQISACYSISSTEQIFLDAVGKQLPTSCFHKKKKLTKAYFNQGWQI